MPTQTSQKIPIAQGLALFAALAVAGVALTTLLSGDEGSEGEVEVDDEGRPLSDDEVAERDHDMLVAAGRNERPGYGALVTAMTAAGPGFYGDGELGLADTRKMFDAVMDEVERMSDRPRRLRQREWAEVYRAANDSFTALSMHLDARDRDQARELEEAHKRLQESLANVRVRGKKFRVEL